MGGDPDFRLTFAEPPPLDRKISVSVKFESGVETMRDRRNSLSYVDPRQTIAIPDFVVRRDFLLQGYPLRTLVLGQVQYLVRPVQVLVLIVQVLADLTKF